MSDLARRIVAHATAADLFPTGGAVLLGVSGGSDSVALLDLMVHGGVATAFDLDVAVVHVDHGIQPQSAEIAREVRRLVERYGVPHRTVVLTLGPGASETTARDARYQALRAAQHDLGAAYLATAHHRDDQVETVVYRVFRGSGVAGLAGIPARGPGGLVRPLLGCRRAELARYLVARGITPPLASDPANVSMRHDRSWIRHELLPRARARFGARLDDWLVRLGAHAAMERRAWRQLLRMLPALGFRRDRSGVEVSVAALVSYDKALSAAILQALGREIGLVIGPQRAARLRRFVQRALSGRRLALGDGWQAEISFDRLRIRRLEDASPPESAEVDLTKEGRLAWGRWEFSWSFARAGEPSRTSRVTWIEAGRARVRGTMPGDRVFPIDGVGRRRVRRMLSEARVPEGDRAHYPVLEQNGDIVWVPGICRAAGGVPPTGTDAIEIEVRGRDESER